MKKILKLVSDTYGSFVGTLVAIIIMTPALLVSVVVSAWIFKLCKYVFFLVW